MRYPILELEREADPDGEWLSYGVRMKLDLVGRKISLEQWKRLPPAARDDLTAASAETEAEIDAFASTLERVLDEAHLDAELLPDSKRAGVADWRDATVATDAARRVLDAAGGGDLWPRLDRYGRYVVCTFARKQDHARLRRALIELGYLSP